jgi:CBS domain-containing protein
VVTVVEHDSVLDAAKVMNTHKIGSVVVLSRDGGSVAGILTERDVLTRVVAQVRDPRTTNARDVMSSPVQACCPTTHLDEVREIMRARRIRHVPVLDGDKLCGMVSIGDLNAFQTRSLTSTVETLEAYIARA